MKNLELVGYSSNGMTSIKNNRNLKKRSGFFESFKKIERKFNLKKQKNEHIKNMNQTELKILRKTLQKEYRMKITFYVLGIVSIIIGMLVIIKFL